MQKNDKHWTALLYLTSVKLNNLLRRISWAFFETRDKDQWFPPSSLQNSGCAEWSRHVLTIPLGWRFFPAASKNCLTQDLVWLQAEISRASVTGCFSWSEQPHVEKSNWCGKVNLANTQVGSGLPIRTKDVEKLVIYKKTWGLGTRRREAGFAREKRWFHVYLRECELFNLTDDKWG